MQLVLINNGHNPKCEEYLLRAAKKRKIEAKVVSTANHLFEIGEKPNKNPDLLYRIAVDKSEALLEQSFLLGGNFVSFFTRNENIKRRTGNKLTRYIDFARAGIPIPPTIFSNATDDLNLKKIVRKLGLPLIIKTLSGSRGEGILFVDSFFALKSTTQLLTSSGIEFIFQKMIHEAGGRHVRVIVIGGEIVCSYQKSISKDIDFRSNTSEFAKRKIIKLDAAAQQIVLAATATAGSEFGGVDLLPTKSGYLVTEVNFPCNFGASQDFTGIDIAGRMVDFLLAKAKHK